MPIAEALADIRGHLENVVPRGTPEGTRPFASAYRDGFADVSRGPQFRVQVITVEIFQPMTKTYITDEDTEAVHAKAEALVDYLHGEGRIGDMHIWWGGGGIQSQISENTKGIRALVSVSLAERLPQV